MKYLSFSTDHQCYLMFLRKHVSRKAAKKGRAVLEGVGLDATTIAACFNDHPQNEEETVQDGLTRWCGGKGFQPPTWKLLTEAMEYAAIARQEIEGLQKDFSL